MTDDNGTRQRMETMIEVYTEFLNLHRQPDIDDYKVVRADYDEYPDDCPFLVHEFYQSDDDVLMIIYANPFHDEGGGHWLTAWFQRNYWEPTVWVIDDMIQEFDTRRTMIYSADRGGVINLWEETKDA